MYVLRNGVYRSHGGLDCAGKRLISLVSYLGCGFVAYMHSEALQMPRQILESQRNHAALDYYTCAHVIATSRTSIPHELQTLLAAVKSINATRTAVS